jgi:hypothetical protein
VHKLTTSFVLAYHGCDSAIAEELLGGKPFKQSRNDYDWLGQGVYFWEANPQRGLDFAAEVATRGRKSLSDAPQPAVIGAVLDLGLCLDMTTLSAIDMVERAYESLKNTFDAAGKELPKNGPDLLLRRLDCAVITRLHSILEQESVFLDTVRGVFIEGSPIYPNSGFNKKTHTQIAVKNLDCIKAVFRVAEDQLVRWNAP